MAGKSKFTVGANRWSRKLHRWGAIFTAIPLLLVIGTGLLLQLKKQVPWVQPPTQNGAVENQDPAQSWPQILEIARSVKEAQVASWEDIDRLDMRPAKGVVKVRSKNSWEIQIDLETGEVLASTYRRSDLIESLHDGSFFSDYVKLGVFLPSGIVLLILWLTGLWLWFLPRQRRRKNQEKA